MPSGTEMISIRIIDIKVSFRVGQSLRCQKLCHRLVQAVGFTEITLQAVIQASVYTA